MHSICNSLHHGRILVTPIHSAQKSSVQHKPWHKVCKRKNPGVGKGKNFLFLAPCDCKLPSELHRKTSSPERPRPRRLGPKAKGLNNLRPKAQAWTDGKLNAKRKRYLLNC